MKKVIFWGIVMAFWVIICTVGNGVVVKAQTIELKMAHFMSPMHIQHQKSFVPFTEKVGELSGGKVRIKIYPGGALGKPKQLPDSVKTGITDIAFIIPSYTTGRFPRSSVLDLPYLFDSAVHATKVIYNVHDKYLAEDYKDYKVLWFYSAGPGQLQSVTRPMHTLESLKGLKMRAPSAYMSKALKKLGVNPVGMPIPKLHMSLEKKVIDGMLIPFSAVKDFRLFDLVKHITVVDMYVTPMAVVMNKEKFNSLPDFAKKAIVQAAGKQWGLHAAHVYDNHDANTLQEIKKQGKIEVYTLPKSETKKFKQQLKTMEAEWIDDMSKRGFPAETAKKMLNAVRRSAQKNR
ncbi:MAG: TRAP transporter substrate-binding protein [Thermodesulfobacteriota bacterium]